jgi:hypothetical protein
LACHRERFANARPADATLAQYCDVALDGTVDVLVSRMRPDHFTEQLIVR